MDNPNLVPIRNTVMIICLLKVMYLISTRLAKLYVNILPELASDAAACHGGIGSLDPTRAMRTHITVIVG